MATAIWSRGADSANLCSADSREKGAPRRQERAGRHRRRAPGAVGTAPATFPCSFSLPGTLRRPQHCVSNQIPGEVPVPKAVALAAWQGLSFVCCDFLIISKRKRARSRGVGDSKAFLMEASDVAIQDLDLINGSFSQITLRLFSFSCRSISAHRVSFLFNS